MLEYKDLVQEVLRHNESERQALLEEIQQSLQPNAQNGAANGHAHQPEIESVTYIGKLDETGQPVVLVRGVDGREEPLPMSALALLFSSVGFSWGINGAGSVSLAHSLLSYQFDTRVADDYAWKLAYDRINKLDPAAQWMLTSQSIEDWLKVKINEPPSEKEIWRAERADYLAEKYK